jgi:hypothetical protein
VEILYAIRLAAADGIFGDELSCEVGAIIGSANGTESRHAPYRICQVQLSACSRLSEVGTDIYASTEAQYEASNKLMH